VAEDHTELSRVSSPLTGDAYSVAVNPADGSCWVAQGSAEGVAHIAEDGTELWRGEGLGAAWGVSVNSTDGSCWVIAGTDVVHLTEDGIELSRPSGFNWPQSVSVNPTDGSCWVADTENHQVAHLSADGAELWRGGGFQGPGSVSVDPTNGSCWVADTGHDQVAHLSADGTELWRGGGFSAPAAVSVDSADGSCWVADRNNGQVVRLAEDGTELLRRAGFMEPSVVAANSADGSCWVDDYESGQITNLAANGTELWRGGGRYGSWGNGRTALAVNPTDGSCWLADPFTAQVALLVIPGWEAPVFPDVPFDFWAFEEIGACVGAGIVGGYEDGLYHPERTVTRGQMAVFVARCLAGGDEGVPDFTGTPTLPDVDSGHWALDYVEYVVDQHVVGGFDDGTYHPEYQVTRDQMAVYMARAMVAPTTSVLADYVPAEPHNFPDVLTDHWAYTYVEYCVEQGVVGGFLDGTYRPDNVVTRDQMAVYVARAFGLAM
jgi:hypothetical protein